MARKKSEFTQTGLVKAAKALTTAGLVVHGAYLIGGGVYLDTRGTFAASQASPIAIADGPEDDPDDDDAHVWAKLDAGPEP